MQRAGRVTEQRLGGPRSGARGRTCRERLGPAPGWPLASLLALWLTASPAAALACDAPPRAGGPAWLPLADAQGPGAWLRAERWPPPVGQPFALTLQLCPEADGSPPRLLGLDAQMPAHRHGMNYRPTLSALGGGAASPGSHRAEGLLFHMPGAWRLTVERGAPPGPRRLTLDVTLP
jgi:hypothetical protein